MSQRLWPLQSLRWRLLLATLVALLLALALTGVLLNRLFTLHVSEQFEQDMTTQLDQLTARIEFDENDTPYIDPLAMSDPRWTRSFSGLYWQVDIVDAHGAIEPGVLRSRSLWDQSLSVNLAAAPAGQIQRVFVTGPLEQRVLVLARTVQTDSPDGKRWRLMVASDTSAQHAAMTHFAGLLASSLSVLFVLLAIAGWLQVHIGLAPLRPLQRALQRLRSGQAARLEGSFPAEVQPLADDLNAVLSHNAKVVERARTQAGNLAHALKTPLAILQQAAFSARTNPTGQELATLIDEQVQQAKRQIDWHLARSRAAAAADTPGQRTSIAESAASLVRTMQRVHADRHLELARIDTENWPDFAGEAQDLYEMLGNLLDNACQWASSQVTIRAQLAAPGNGQARARIVIEDDGPGIAPERHGSVMQRGTRLDESVPGTGLGLSIVAELADLYGGTLQLQQAASGGLRAELELPAAPPVQA